MAKNTLTPIQYVPLIILYANGTPLARYDGANNIEHWMNQSQIKPTPEYVHNIGNLLAISKKVNSAEI